eukprot:CCRYP_015626-RB/>CCRYP_015626-RB protein AED:0.19 eAED:0.19 QI:188/0.88/0.9/1/0.77/0.7/10/1719/673
MAPNTDDGVKASLELDESSSTNNTPQVTTSKSGGSGINLQQYNHLFIQPTAQGSGMIDPSPLISHDLIAHDADGAAGLNEQEMANLPERGDSENSSPSWHHPVQSTMNYFNTLSSFFTQQFLSWLAICQFCVNGGMFTLVMSLSLPIFQQLEVSASRQQLYTTMMLSPWAMKPFIGVASDLFPIFGYNKRFFALYSVLIGLAGCIVLLVLFHSETPHRAVEQGADAVQSLADAIVLCFTAVSFEAATLDILSEGKYSELMRIYPESGSSIISWKFGWSLAGSIITQSYVGPLSDAGYWHTLFWIATILSITPFYPTIRNSMLVAATFSSLVMFRGWMPEKKRSSDEVGMMKLCPCCLFDIGGFKQKRTPFIVITLSGLAGPILAAVTTFADLNIGLISSAVMLLVLAITTWLVFPRVLFYVTTSMLLINLSSPTIGSALSYFYTASEECLPDGPHFSYTYYITVTGIVSSVVSFLAVVLYQATISSWRFRPAFMFTIVAGSLSTIIDVVIVQRWNISFGISDKLFFFLGNAVFESLVGILLGLPMSAIFAKIAPPGMESAVFAYVVGIQNFGNMLSGLLGSGIIQWSGMTTVGDNCDFSNLAEMIVIWKILIPILVGIPATFLVPNKLQTEPLIDWKEEKWYGSEHEETDERVQNEADTKEHIAVPQAEPYFV